MGKPKPPQPPDPKVTAAAQTGTNLATAQANAALGNVNQITPYGNLKYSQTGQQFIEDANGTAYWRGPNGELQTNAPGMVTTPGTSSASSGKWVDVGGGRQWLPGGLPGGQTQTTKSMPAGWSQVKGYNVPTYTAEQTLSPEQRAIFDQTQGAQLNLASLAKDQSSRLQQLLGTPFTLDGLPSAGVAPDLQTSYVDDFSADRQRVEDALMQRLNPGLEAGAENTRANLLNQGIRAGSRAYDRGIDEVNRTATDARLGAILAGGEEQSRLAGLSRDQAVFGNTAKQQGFLNTNALRDRALQEQFALRNQPLNEISALLSGSQITQPNFVNANMPNIPTVDYAGLVNENYNQKMGIYNQQSAQSQGLLGGLFGLGASFLKSDINAKTNIRRVGTLDNGLAVYAYRYKEGGPTMIGVMAQDVEKVNPGAVAEFDGVKYVNYDQAVL